MQVLQATSRQCVVASVCSSECRQQSAAASGYTRRNAGVHEVGPGGVKASLWCMPRLAWTLHVRAGIRACVRAVVANRDTPACMNDWVPEQPKQWLIYLYIKFVFCLDLSRN